MTWILSMHDYKQRQLPTVGYLKASSGRGDSDCLNRPHLANVMQARRDRENYAHPSGEDTPGPLTPRAGHDAPDLPAASLVERESAHPWRWVATFALFFGLMCIGLFAPPAAQFAIAVILAVMAGAVIGFTVRL